MSAAATKKDHWREVYRQKRLKNAQLWLEEFTSTVDPAALTTRNYSKILQAIEQTLKHEDSFDTGCELLREVFPIAYGMADWGRWLTYLKGALEMSKRLMSRRNEAYLHEWIGDIELSFVNLPEAEKHFRRSLELYLDEGDTVRYGRNLPQLSRVFAAQGDFPKALALCQEALRLGEKEMSPIVIGAGRAGLGEVYQQMGERERAIAEFEAGIAHFKMVGKFNLVFRLRTQIVGCKVFLERYEEAEAEADELMKLFESSESAYDNLISMMYLRNVIGFVAFKSEKYLEAEKHWQEAYHQGLMVGSPDTIASIGNNLGKVYTILNEFDAADEMLRESLGRFERMGDVSRWANCMDNLVDLFERKGEMDAARAILEQAIGRLEADANWPHNQKLLRDMKQRLEKIPVG